MGTTEAQLRLPFEDDTDFDEALSGLALARFIDGSQPYVACFDIEGVGRPNWCRWVRCSGR